MLMGAPRAGMIAVVWLALHPWHVRYGVDARGYALLFTLLPLSMALLWRAVATGGMNGWLAYGLVEFMVLWTYPGALYFVMILNVVACGLLATGPVPEGLSRGLQWRRFAVANLIGAMLTFLMLAPCIQPMVIFLKGGRLRGDVAWGWVMDTLSGLLTGIPWEKWEDHQLALAWMRNGDKDLWRTVLPVAVILLAFLTGVGAMWSQGRGKRWLLALLVLVGPFMFFMARSAGNILYPWYLVVCLPGVAILIGVGVDAVATRWCSERYRWVLPVYFLTLFGAMTWRQNQVLRNHPIEPMRESVAATRMERNALTAQLPGKVLTASVCYPARLYDPAAVHLASVADLRTLMSQADAQKLPLYVNFGDQDFLKLRDPALLALLEDRSQFQALPPFLGIHNQHERRVYCYLGKGKPGG